MRLTIDIEVTDLEPFAGAVRTAGGEIRPFAGWLELLTLLHEAIGPWEAAQQ